MESIQRKINRFYNPIRVYDENGTNTRYKSWEWCHQAFMDKRHEYWDPENLNKDDIVNELALHLAFYLASWGMYRGSSFLLQRDYKAHKKAVRAILDEKYKNLWNYNPEEDNDIDNAIELLFSVEQDEEQYKGIYWRIKYSYGDIDLKTDDLVYEDLATDTLVTKILMGTYACVPAFDRFLKAGISAYKKGNREERPQLTQKIEDEQGTNFKALSRFVIAHHIGELELESEIDYPPMKLLDMFFWEIGYEKDLAKDIENLQSALSKANQEQNPDEEKINKIEVKIEELLKKVKDLYSLDEELDCESAIEEINTRNTGSLERE